MRTLRYIHHGHRPEGEPGPRFEELGTPVSSRVHYCGFRYGRSEFNPLENSARRIFNACFQSAIRWRTTNTPAEIIGTPGWKETYSQ